VISNKDGEDKQDCEINASKRWLDREHIIAKKYKLAILGDDLYCKTSLIKKIREKKHNYIFVCKESSHKKMYETINYVEKLGEVDTKVVQVVINPKRKRVTAINISIPLILRVIRIHYRLTGVVLK
jgi:hypothetical protein